VRELLPDARRAEANDAQRRSALYWRRSALYWFAALLKAGRR